MTKLVMFATCVLAALGARQATAGAPAWCGNAKFDANGEDLRRLSDQNPETVMEAIATTLCSTNALAESHRDEVEPARVAWGKKMYMVDADWADEVAYVKSHDRIIVKPDVSAKSIADFTPIDQYIAITGGEISASYLADAFGAQMSNTARMPFINECLRTSSVQPNDYAVMWAMCQADIDAFDATKVSEEVRGDTKHPGENRMLMRYQAMGMRAMLAKHATEVDKLWKLDPEYKKLFDTAKASRAEWTKRFGSSSKLVSLVAEGDSAQYSHSRKQREGCEAATAAALGEAISAVPAKKFAGMHDVHDYENGEGFAAKAVPVLVADPTVNLAATAYADCHEDVFAEALAAGLARVYGQRGPHTAALDAMMRTTFTFDDTKTGALRYPEFGRRPFTKHSGGWSSLGGIVTKIATSKDEVVVSVEKTSMQYVDCVKAHRGKHIEQILANGTLVYEQICDQSAVVTQDTTWPDFHIIPASAKPLKRGMLFSAARTSGGGLYDVIAVWPSKTAKQPSIVFGAAVK